MTHRPIEAPRERSKIKGISQRVEDLTSLGDDLYVAVPQGESIPIAARVERSMKRDIQKIVQSGKTRFETESDFVRAAVHFFIQDYKDQLLVFSTSEAAQMQRAIARRRETSRNWDFVKLCNGSRDALLKMFKVSPARAVEEYTAYMDEVRAIDPVLAREYAAWAKKDPALSKLMDFMDKGKKRRAADDEEE